VSGGKSLGFESFWLFVEAPALILFALNEPQHASKKRIE
jgi:hypothetical protein